MINRLTLTFALVALFGFAFSFIAQSMTSRPGSAFASEAGASCSYSLGIVCKINRDEAGAVSTASGS